MLLKSQSMMWPSEITFHKQRAEFMDLANEFQSLFTEAPGTTNLAQHHIKLTSDQPVRSRPYPVPYSLRESLKDITDMMNMGVIRESSSPYASPVVVVKKKRQHKSCMHGLSATE